MRVTCSIEGCEETPVGRGWCRRHYYAWKRNGAPVLVRKTLSGDVLRWIQEIALPYTGNECLKWPFSEDGRGYGHMTFKGRMTKASRVVCTLTHGPAPTMKHQALHGCGQGHKGCVSPQHLRWGTNSENQQERRVHGTANIGEQHPQAKLTDHAVREIRRRNGAEPRKLAAEYGVTVWSIYNVISGRRWQHV